MSIAPFPIAAIANSSPKTRVIRSIRQWISDGQWAAGEKLPTEMDLVEKLGVSRGTVRSALQVLETEGLVQELPGRGRKARGRIVSPLRPSAAPYERSARALMSRTVALVTHGIGLISDNPDLYAAGRAEMAVDAGINQALRDSQLHVLYVNAAAFAGRELDDLIASHPLGVIVGPTASRDPHVQPLLARLSESKIALITTGHDLENLDSDRVISDHEVGAYMLTKWLIERGCKRIVQITSAATSGKVGWSQARYRGYGAALAEAGLEPLPRIDAPNVDQQSIGIIGPSLKRGLTPSTGREHFERRVRQIAGFVASVVLGANPVDAIMASNDWDASLILAACRLLGMEPNERVAVVGYDDWWDTEEREWEPAVPLATVNKENAEVGRQAVKMLMDRVEGKLPAGSQVRRVVPRLVEIKSEVKCLSN